MHRKTCRQFVYIWRYKSVFHLWQTRGSDNGLCMSIINKTLNISKKQGSVIRILIILDGHLSTKISSINRAKKQSHPFYSLLLIFFPNQPVYGYPVMKIIAACKVSTSYLLSSVFRHVTTFYFQPEGEDSN